MHLEWLILADFADFVGGKLYLQGGGWDRLTVNGPFPTNRVVGVAASFRVPWTETNQTASFEIEIMTEDGPSVGPSLLTMSGQFRVGQPPNHPPGQDQRAQIAKTGVLKFEKPGVNVVVARLDGEEVGRTPFFVVSGAGQMIAQ